MAVTNTAAPLHDLTAFQRDLLVVIAGMETEADVPYGLEIKRRIEAAYGEEINHGRLYPNLNTLAELGLVKKTPVDDRTNSYAITSRGRRELGAHREWMATGSGGD